MRCHLDEDRAWIEAPLKPSSAYEEQWVNRRRRLEDLTQVPVVRSHCITCLSSEHEKRTDRLEEVSTDGVADTDAPDANVGHSELMARSPSLRGL